MRNFCDFLKCIHILKTYCRFLELNFKSSVFGKFELPQMNVVGTLKEPFKNNLTETAILSTYNVRV